MSLSVILQFPVHNALGMLFFLFKPENICTVNA